MKSAAGLLSKEEQQRINRLYYDVLGKDDMEIVNDLARHFETTTMVKKAPDGKVDEHATLAACGAYEVLSYIRQRIKFGETGK